MSSDTCGDVRRQPRLSVLHVSGDFPDPIEPFKTPVVRSLIDLTANEFDHSVISINRAEPPKARTACEIIKCGPLQIETQGYEYGTAVRYFAPGRGILHKTKLVQLGDWLVDQISRMPRRPDLLIGHKLTIEGIAVRRAADALRLPYAISIQGNTDTKILARRLDLKRDFAEIFHGAQTVFPFTPWALKSVEMSLGRRTAWTYELPCPTELDQPLKPVLEGKRFISVFHLKNWKGKNLEGLVKAWKILAKRGTPPPLEIIGGGTDEELDACRALARGVPQITFAGAIAGEQLAKRMNAATALVMPSLRESFGLVFLESLFAGAPIIYPQDTAIDGYFDAAPFAIRVDARSPHSIADAVDRAIAAEREMKRDLATWQGSAEARKFTRRQIALTFKAGLEQAAHSG